MADLDLCYASASTLARMMRRREVSPVEVVENALARIAEVNGRLNCFCFVYPDEARAAARDAEQAIVAGRPLGPLHGVPIAIKDLTPTRGKRTTMGSYIHEHWIPEHDAAVVERLRKAGAIMVGKTTTPELAFSFFTDSPLWGVTRNPWDLERTPGGSSGGSAAAVATGCVPLAEGSDTGGSIRFPAALCGLVGLKPSLGRIPFEIFPSLHDQTGHFGPLARTTADAALFLAATQGPDERDLQTQTVPLDIPQALPADIRGLRIAFSPDLGYCMIDDEVARNADAMATTLRDLGAEVERVDLTLTPREDGGWTQWSIYYAALLGDKLAHWRDRMDPRLVAQVERGLSLDAMAAKHNEFYRADQWARLRPILEAYDALICPTAAVPAPPLSEWDTDYGHRDAQGRYRGLELCFHFNVLSHCPALSVPSGRTSRGLPTSIQIVGRRQDDLTVLRIGAALEKAVGWPAWRPPI